MRAKRHRAALAGRGDRRFKGAARDTVSADRAHSPVAPPPIRTRAWTRHAAALAGLLVTFPSCTEDDVEGDPRLGEDVYFESLDYADDEFTCELCHALEEPSDQWIRPGHPIGDAIRRPHFKNGTIDSLMEASNVCLEEWMGVDEEDLWTGDHADWRNLEAFLQQEAPKNMAEPLEVELAEPLMGAALEGGDPQLGREIFNVSCALCHGVDGDGGLVFGLRDLNLMPDLIARKVRLSGPGNSNIFDGLNGGQMPFWAADRLSDDDIRDIVAFLTE